MNKLIAVAAVAAVSAGLFAAEGESAQQPAQAAAEAPAAVAVQAPEASEAVRTPAVRGAGAFNRAAFEERMKKRQEERRGKVAEILKAAGIPEDKVAAVVDEVDKVYARRPPQRPSRPAGRRETPRPRQRPQPQAAPAQK